ncbi:unnamed protein product [Aphanomyces euteiches]|uniref:Protein kinase domain-containing protein n=1 Tax=Aphanomyces euteiches TaxID=100861 RepID=A0A6G0XSV1_9STRA|nr:hypothetical protein Ae201684_001746 [Aphanomyces euteiches]KAH9075426.1 hypothetical protein Ae201684P_004106 [Aphanomyces euteiches]KAH9137476.1 hypothetical protein AeRB84_017825 [Aphanomyces euteiches]
MAQGWIYGIVVGGFLVVVLAVFALYRCFRRNKLAAADGDYKASLQSPQENQTKVPIQSSPVDPPSTALFPELVPFRIQHSDIQFLRQITRGQYGNTWYGQYNNRPVAVKVSSPWDDYAFHMAKQIQVMARIQSPNIVCFLGATWTSANDLSAVVEYMPGGSLRKLLDNPKVKLSWPVEKINVALDIAKALAYLHSLTPSLVIRELHSWKILLTDTMVAKLSNFRLDQKYAVEPTMCCAIPLTERWIAPEVILGEDFTEAPAVYSFGVILSEFDKREIPFGDIRSNAEVISKIARGILKPAFRPTCPAPVRRVADACLQFDPSLRPSSAQVVEMLEQAKLALNQPISDDVVEASEIV